MNSFGGGELESELDSKSLIEVRVETAATPAAELVLRQDGDQWVGEWQGGRLRVRRPAVVAERDGLVCIVRGSPRSVGGNARSAEHWLGLFASRGSEAIADIRGRFAIALIDTRRNVVTLFNDRFDTEPWCYAEEKGALALSDRANGVPVRSRTVSTQAIFNYLYFHVIPSPDTVFNEVRRLLPASRLDWKGGALQLARYWTPRFDEHPGLSLEQAKGRFLDIVQASVEREYTGDGTGAFLSGGTDSSSVSGMLCRISGKPAKTYSMGFDAQGYDEMEYARIAARHFKTDHHEYYVTPDDLLDGIPKVACSYDQPFGNSSAVPAWICATRAREDGVTKLLAGDGGDELFGGNSRYATQRIFGWYNTIPSLLRAAVVEPISALPGMKRIPLVRKGVSYVEQASIPMPDRLEIYNLLIRLGMDKVFTPGFLKGIDVHGPGQLQRATWAEVGDASLVNHMLAFDWKYTLADNDLPKVVGTTRLAGLDVGFPLLSDELLDFSLTLPTEWKLKGLKLRWMFKEALRGFLPDEIITKKKHGFGLPFGVWAIKHPGLRKLATDALESFSARGVMSPAFLREVLEKRLPEHPGYYGEMVWIVMVLEFWLQAHAPQWRFDGA
ncbi:MAG: asparagine synthase [Proteobacteria bacterium]|nr:asparagine synthase [Pseudomonadota bacterium]